MGKHKLLRLRDLLEQLRLPNHRDHLSREAFDATYLKQLGIIKRLADGSEKPKGMGDSTAVYITEEDAARVVTEFKNKHWRIFHGELTRKGI